MAAQTSNPGYLVRWYELRSLGIRGPPDHRCELSAEEGLEVRRTDGGDPIPVSSVSTMTWVSGSGAKTVVVARPGSPVAPPTPGQEFRTAFGGLEIEAGLTIERYTLDPAGKLVDLILTRYTPVI